MFCDPEMSRAARLSTKSILQFERDGHLLVRQCLPREAIPPIAAALRADSAAQNGLALRHAAANVERLGGDAPFMQFFNAHRRSRALWHAAELLAHPASALLGATRLRLYQVM